MFYEDNDYYRPYRSTAPNGQGMVGGNVSQQTTWADMEEDAFQSPLYSVRGPMPAPYPRKTGKNKRSGGGGIVAIAGLVTMLLVVLGTGLFAGWVFASGSSATIAATQVIGSTSSSTTVTNASGVEAQQEAAIARIEPSVVELAVTTAQGEQIGSGVIIDKNGDIVTNNHVISGAQAITVVLQNGNSEKAQIVGSDAGDDLAVVRITPTPYMAVATIGDSSKLSVGQEVLAVGNPLGITETATKGIISALNRSVRESSGVTIAGAIQTDAPINPGNSGGALVNLQGQLVGIPTLAALDTESNTPANGVGFAIPANLVKKAVAQIVH